MLQRLSIQNYALIDQLSVDFKDGFTTITGETGAGKSIILGGLSLVLGTRSDQSYILNKDKKCVIEAEFDVSRLSLTSFFNENDLDYESDTIVRREILSNGKSRAFINDSPVSLKILSDLSEYLIDIHTQHQTRSLIEQSYQLEVLDQVAKTEDLLSIYSSQLYDYKIAEDSLSKLLCSKAEGEADREYKVFLLDELNTAKLHSGMLEALEREAEVLQNVDQIEQSLSMARQTIGADDIGVTELLRQVKLALTPIASISSKYQDLLDRVNSSLIELDDVLSDVDELEGTVESDPEKLELINTQLHHLQLLFTKHRATNVDELITIRDVLTKEVQLIENIDQAIADQEQECIEAKQALIKTSNQIHDLRDKVIPSIVAFLESNLKDLGMPDAKFDIILEPTEQFLANGCDRVNWLFCSSKGGTFQMLKKSASGGELSRIMLVVKALLSRHQNLPALIFDEIDTGVSGEIASKMGGIMSEMSRTMQVIAITHLPQIAAQGKTHFKVYKSNERDKTVVQIKALHPEQRIKEIAGMLSGSVLTEAAIANAKELLN